MSEGNLPKGWAEARIGDLVHLVNGMAFKPSQWSSQGLPIIRIQNLNDADASFNYCSEDLPEKFRVRTGDLLFAWSGTPGTSFGAHVWRGGEAWLNQHIFNVLFDRTSLHPTFLRYAINQNLDSYIRQAHGGAGLAHITKGRFEDSVLSIAPLPEQHRIVEKIEELFSDLDAGVASLERAKANLKRYRASVLKSAVEGRLTEEWRREHPQAEDGGMLLDRILRERREKWEKDQLVKFKEKGKEPPKNWESKYEEPSAPETSELPELPEGWVWVTVEQLLHGIEGGTSFQCLPRMATAEEWGVIKVSAMTWGTFLEEEQKALPPETEFDPATEIRHGDLLLSRCNTVELVGASVLVSECRPRLLLSDKSLRLLASACINKQWLHKVMSSRMVRQQMSDVATGSSNSMRNISQDKIKAVRIPLPPLAEQEQIVALVEERLSQIDSAEKTIDAELIRSKRLRQSILKRAFEGKFVPQDPKDEPASVLLERIKATREAEQPKKKSKKARARQQTNP